MPLTHTLLIINIITFILSFVSSTMYEELGLRPEKILAGERVYTLITSMYLHAGPIHLIFNMLFLVILGMMLEEKIGTLRYGIIYYASGIAAGLTFSVTTGLLQPNVIAVGASGGLFGIMGAYARLYPNEKFAFFPFPYPLPIYTWALIFLLLAFAGTFAQGICFENIAHLAHVGGLFAGLVLAPLVMRIPAKEKKKVTKVDFAALGILARTDEDRELLERMEKEDEPEVRNAWLEHFLSKTRCPQCGEKLATRGRRASCRCGFELKF